MTDNQTESNTTEEDIQFIEFHLPALQDGTYRVGVTQTLEAHQGGKKNSIAGSQEMFFSVLGPRFSMDPREVRAVFPPDGSTGDHSNVLPHVVLNRSTLPWERNALPPLSDEEEKAFRALVDATGKMGNHKAALATMKEDQKPANDALEKKRTPWLALLLFDESDPPPTPDMKNAADVSALLELTPEIGHHADEQVSVIDVPVMLLKDILPHKDELGHLCHVRQWYKNEKDTGEIALDGERAVIICNRLPRAGKRSTVHLVSLEDRYNDSRFIIPDNAEKVSLVSLKSWQFTCLADRGNFKNLLEDLDRKPSTLRLPDSVLLSETKSEDTDNEAQRFLKMGYVPAKHQLRGGDRTVSWYRGPFAPGMIEQKIEEESKQYRLPARTADKLLQYHDKYGMFDVSYAAAWELGRLLMLQSKKVSVSLFHWKREHAAKTKDAVNHSKGGASGIRNLLDHLQVAGLRDSAPDMPEAVRLWFQDLALLKNVPFNYLVPDEKMLPKESIRFFRVDPYWVECLLDGAFSIGRTSEKDSERDGSHSDDKNPGNNPHRDSGLSGFLMRSQVVAGWPDLQVDGYLQRIENINTPPATNAALKPIRIERLSPNVLICLFEGSIETVDIHLKAEALHFGVSQFDEEHPLEQYPSGYFKELRGRNGQEESQLDPITDASLIKNLKSASDDSLKSHTGAWYKSLESEFKKSGVPFNPSIRRVGKDSKWRMTLTDKNSDHWTFYLQHDGDKLTIQKTLAVMVPPRFANLPLIDEDTRNRRVLDMAKMFAELQSGLEKFDFKKGVDFTAAEFALEMVEGVQKVRFVMNK